MCNACVHVTSVHDTAQGFRGVGLRQRQAEVAERIGDTLHRPDDTYSTGQGGHLHHLYQLLKYLNALMEINPAQHSHNKKVTSAHLHHSFYPKLN